MLKVTNSLPLESTQALVYTFLIWWICTKLQLVAPKDVSFRCVSHKKHLVAITPLICYSSDEEPPYPLCQAVQAASFYPVELFWLSYLYSIGPAPPKGTPPAGIGSPASPARAALVLWNYSPENSRIPQGRQATPPAQHRALHARHFAHPAACRCRPLNPPRPTQNPASETPEPSNRKKEKRRSLRWQVAPGELKLWK